MPSLAPSAVLPILRDRCAAATVIPWAELEVSTQQSLQQALVFTEPPVCLLEPRDEDELSQAIALAQEQGWPLQICGSGTKLSWGKPIDSVPLILRTTCLDRILHYAPADLTITVEAGITLQKLQQHLSEQGQFIPLDPAYADAATLGGILATADAGSLRHRYGAVRDLILGIQFVRADGQVAKAGGRVVKNVAGYDLMKLFTGAYGTLGILSQITLKTYPIPERFQTVVLTGELQQLAQAAQALAISTFNPVAFDWLSRGLVQALGLGDGVAIALRFGSMAASTLEQCNEVKLLGQQLHLAVTTLGDQSEQSFWQQLGQHLDAQPLRCKLAVLPNAVPNLIQKIEQQSATACCRIHQASGLGMLCDQPDAWESAMLQQLRQQCDDNGGFLTVLEAPANLKQQMDIWGYGGNAILPMTKLREQFDPQKTLNPGRFLV